MEPEFVKMKLPILIVGFFIAVCKGKLLFSDLFLTNFPMDAYLQRKVGKPMLLVCLLVTESLF